jgi:predicted PurR-regulated permease PerM
MFAIPATWTERLAQLLFVLVVLSLLGWGAGTLAPVLAPVTLSLLLAYFLHPLVDRIERYGVRRMLAIGVLAFALLGGTVGIAAVFITQIVPEVANALPLIQQNLVAFVSDPDTWMLTHPDATVTRTWSWLAPYLGMTSLSESTGSIRESLAAVLSQVGTGALSVLNLVAASIQQSIAAVLNIILIPIFTFYFLMDFDGFVAWPLRFVPTRFRPHLMDWARRMDTIVGNWIRGQLIVAGILGVLYAIGLSAFGIRLGWAIGLVAGILNVVPYLGVFAGLLMSIAMALMGDAVTFQLAGVAVVFVVVQLLEGNLITPRLVGEAVGMSPLLVMVVLLVGGSLFGFFGLVFAIPFVAAATVVAGDLMTMYQRSRFFDAGGDTLNADSDVVPPTVEQPAPNGEGDEEPGPS